MCMSFVALNAKIILLCSLCEVFFQLSYTVHLISIYKWLVSIQFAIGDFFLT
uniref:Uncharacterized protein n=1 Tax=Anguilla anguilla TaxID=7936 RepID=A0A0E9P982_ANGAN